MSDSPAQADVLTDEDRAILKPFNERLAALRRRKNRTEHWAPNKRYVIDFEIDNSEVPFFFVNGSRDVTSNTEFAFRDSQTNVDQNSVFQCEEIEVIYSLIGTSEATGLPATFVIPPPWRSLFVDFYLKFHDTGSDREWQNDWVPGDFFQSANLGGLILGDEGHMLVSGGAAIVASLQIAKNSVAALTHSGLSEIVQHQVKISLIGCQVPLEGA